VRNLQTATATSQPESGLPSTMGTLQRSRTGNTRLRYFRQSDASLRSLLNQRQAPLVLAGFEDLLSGLSDANTYPVLLPSGVPDNPDRVSAEDQLREILSAIYEGSVGRLFIKTDVELWGAYDAARAKCLFTGERSRATKNLLDLAAIQASVHGATV
jgi:hypothetical protein